MTVVLVLNGASPSVPVLRFWAGKGAVYAADGGARICQEAGVRPEAVVGDFDSSDSAGLPPEWAQIRLPNQDSTDFEKVLSVLPAVPSSLVILGGLGKRLDHTLTNLLIAGELDPSIEVRLIGEEAELIRVTPQAPWHARLEPGTSVSLLPLQEVLGVVSKGLRWNLEDHTMGPGAQLGQSNQVAEAEVSVQIQGGCLWVWLPAPGRGSEPLAG